MLFEYFKLFNLKAKVQYVIKYLYYTNKSNLTSNNPISWFTQYKVLRLCTHHGEIASKEGLNEATEDGDGDN